MQELKQKRIESIDIVRGLAMVLMALDHSRDYFHIGANIDDPLNLATTTPLLFFTRWITHFCAPIFIFLSGTSIYLQTLRKTKKELSSFLIKRGLWLVFVELFIITLAWSFNPFYNVFFLQVIWAIGISMVLMGLIIYLPYKYILVLGLLIVLGHNTFDRIEASSTFKHNIFLDLLHSSRFSFYEVFKNHFIVIAYPFLPWTGVMILGYCLGKLYSTDNENKKRKKIILLMGIGLILLFIVLRWFNIYGDPQVWSFQKKSFFSFLSFINVHKYPPSLLYLCITLGPSLIILAVIENVKNRFSEVLKIFGRTAFFYYILHLYLIHFITAIFYFINGHTLKEIGDNNNSPFLFVVPGEGVTLLFVYLAWYIVVSLLYPLCKWYNFYKSNNKEKWWLSYL